ncbi:MAG TPA: hypothetical protein P5180_03360 [Bacteroidales bacterium]|nr:hypothetical protein [Bacteroidales bacterium]
MKNKRTCSRRTAIRNIAALPLLGVTGKDIFNAAAETVSGSMPAVFQDLKGVLPKGKLGKHEISRLIIGSNPINGFAHSRDLTYVGALFRAYNTEKKVFETLMLAEQSGINCIGSGFASLALLAKYRKETGSSIIIIGQVGLVRNSSNIFEQFDQAIDFGVDIIQLHGEWCDRLVVEKRFDDIARLLEYVRKHGMTVGLGAHMVDSQIACAEKGIIPDYYMVTMHHSKYWSAHPMEKRVAYESIGARQPEHDRWHDNCWCTFPDRTVEFVSKATVPVMGFKTMAAGAIPPRDGIRWAFENGADFVNAGMLDFQLISDINTTIDILNNLPARTRKWFG